jgi:anaerobic selenocysteine-containing dehydrogenase
LTLFRRLARKLTGESQVLGGLTDEARGEGDDILLSGDRLPNRTALAWLGLRETTGAEIAELAGDRGVVLVYGGDPAAVPEIARALQRGRVVYLGTHANATSALAELVIPLAMWAEKDGLSVNRQGRVQRSQRAIMPPGEAREDWRVLVELLGDTVAGLPALRRLVAAELGLEDPDVLNNLPAEGMVPRVPAPAPATEED